MCIANDVFITIAMLLLLTVFPVLFLQLVPCEGAIDGWLSTLLHQLQVSLKQQVVSALREEDPLLRTSLTSAGANRIESKHSKCMYLPINYGATVFAIYF